MDLYGTPALDLEDHRVLGEIRDVRDRLGFALRAPRRWTAGLRRTVQARAIQGSNTIEGYTVSDQDAAAAVDGEEPLSADARTWAEIVGYRRVLTFVLNVATPPGFVVQESILTSMHFMLLEHELAKAPGRYRDGMVYVRDDAHDRTVYTGPDPELVPELMSSFTDRLQRPQSPDPLVEAAMAHLNLVMIHPFKDGNGRMARAVQTMALARDQVIEPTFSSIEEWLGSNTDDYYRVLAVTGRGSWNPDNDAHLWLKFNLRAHHMQAQTLERRFEDSARMWDRVDELIALHGLPERVGDPLFDAVLGQRVTRPTYLKRVELEERTASRDLARLVKLGLLEPHGQTRGRYYLAGPPLSEVRAELRRARRPLEDPYPTFVAELRRQSEMMNG
jgi:Fic family protein